MQSKSGIAQCFCVVKRFLKKFSFFVGKSQRRKALFCYKLFLRRKDFIFDKIHCVVVVRDEMILKRYIQEFCNSVESKQSGSDNLDSTLHCVPL